MVERVTEEDGRLSGRIGKLFSRSRPDPVCEHCTDERNGQPIVGTLFGRTQAWIHEQ
jgi:hypothetical protein